MFVRTKTIKGQKYAYLVENRWRRNKAKQKVKKYLGKIIEPSLQTATYEDIFLDNSQKMIRQIIIRQLLFAGCKQKTKNTFFLNKTIVDLGKGHITEQEKDVVIKMNTGYFYGKTLRELFKLKYDPLEHRAGMTIAEAFIKAGVKITQAEFIYLFELLEKEYD